MSFMKMKNFIMYNRTNIDENAIPIAVSHREIFRIRDRILADQLPYRIINLKAKDPNDLNFAVSGARYFVISTI